jgi:hypothetical protein
MKQWVKRAFINNGNGMITEKEGSIPNSDQS